MNNLDSHPPSLRLLSLLNLVAFTFTNFSIHKSVVSDLQSNCDKTFHSLTCKQEVQTLRNSRTTGANYDKISYNTLEEVRGDGFGEVVYIFKCT